jgi:hypothetical protein
MDGEIKRPEGEDEPDGEIKKQLYGNKIRTQPGGGSWHDDYRVAGCFSD